MAALPLEVRDGAHCVLHEAGTVQGGLDVLGDDFGDMVKVERRIWREDVREMVALHRENKNNWSSPREGWCSDLETKLLWLPTEASANVQSWEVFSRLPISVTGRELGVKDDDNSEFLSSLMSDAKIAWNDDREWGYVRRLLHEAGWKVGASIDSWVDAEIGVRLVPQLRQAVISWYLAGCPDTRVSGANPFGESPLITPGRMPQRDYERHTELHLTATSSPLVSNPLLAWRAVTESAVRELVAHVMSTEAAPSTLTPTARQRWWWWETYGIPTDWISDETSFAAGAWEVFAHLPNLHSVVEERSQSGRYLTSCAAAAGLDPTDLQDVAWVAWALYECDGVSLDEGLGEDPATEARVAGNLLHAEAGLWQRQGREPVRARLGDNVYDPAATTPIGRIPRWSSVRAVATGEVSYAAPEPLSEAEHGPTLDKSRTTSAAAGSTSATVPAGAPPQLAPAPTASPQPADAVLSVLWERAEPTLTSRLQTA